MELTFASLQGHSFTPISESYPNESNKTALTLLEEFKHLANESPRQNPSPKVVEMVIDNKAGMLIVSGVHGPVKIFNIARKLLLIRTAQHNRAQFKIDHLKSGRYILEAEHQFFEFVR